MSNLRFRIFNLWLFLILFLVRLAKLSKVYRTPLFMDHVKCLNKQVGQTIHKFHHSVQSQPNIEWLTNGLIRDFDFSFLRIETSFFCPSCWQHGSKLFSQSCWQPDSNYENLASNYARDELFLKERAQLMLAL